MAENCLVITQQIKDMASKLQGETPATIAALIGSWQTDNKKGIDQYPSLEELKKYRNQIRANTPKSINIIVTSPEKYNRALALKNPRTLFVFTDNTDRTSGKTANVGGWYAEKYGKNLSFGTINNPTTAVIRGLENAYPISTMKWFYKNHDVSVNNARWEDADINEFKKVIDDEISQLRVAWNSGKYDRIVIPSGDGFFNSKIANISKERTPQIYNYLQQVWSDFSNEVVPTELPIFQEASDMLLESFERQTEAVDNDTAFKVPAISVVEEQVRADLDFDPVIRRDRVMLLSRLFSSEVDKSLKQHIETIRRRLVEEPDNADLHKELSRLDRKRVISIDTPRVLFDRIRDGIFQSYLNSTMEQRIQAELDDINTNEDYNSYSPEAKLKGATRKAEYHTKEFEKILRNFNVLAEEASMILKTTEEIIIELDDAFEKEDVYKERWMTKFREVSSHDSLSQEVRSTLRGIVKLSKDSYIDDNNQKKYYPEVDDLGFVKYLEPEYVHAVLMDKLRHMQDNEDLIPLLQEMIKTKPWVQNIIDQLNQDKRLKSKFYQDFKKDFVTMRIVKRKLQADGSVKSETITLNRPEGIYYLLEEWRDNYEAGTKLSDFSVYKDNRDLHLGNAEKGLQWVNKLNNLFNNLSNEEVQAEVAKPEVFNEIKKLLNMVGISVDPQVLQDSLQNLPQVPGITFTPPAKLILTNLNIIFKGIKDGDIPATSQNQNENTPESKSDLINAFGRAYTQIAEQLAAMNEEAIESSVYENGKMHYAHVVPSYLGKLMLKLKDSVSNKKPKDPKYKSAFEEFMDTEFKQYSWFFKDGQWRNDWLRQLAENPEARKALEHHVVLNSDKVEYEKWGDLDYAIVLLSEYWSNPDNKGKFKLASYHLPILSDTASAEFIQFRKYTNGDETDADGNDLTYQEIITNKLVDVVSQEFDRIVMVLQRQALIKAGDKTVLPLANFDIRGAEFQFLPDLNSFRNPDGTTFLKELVRLMDAKDTFGFEKYVKKTISKIVEDNFEKEYVKFHKMGLFEETTSGDHMKHLPFVGQSKFNKNTVSSLKNASGLLGKTWTPAMEKLLQSYIKNIPVDDRKAADTFSEIKTALTNAVQLGTAKIGDVESVSRNLRVHNNSKEAIREYYWNSTLATAMITQITTTDYAFYKNIEDFQKRFKQVHSPALRLDLSSELARQFERTIYLQDWVTPSSMLRELKEALDERVRTGKMSSIDRDNIMSQFKKVNVADAQAYRSLSSYRAILDMQGQWGEKEEKAYNNIKEGKWDMNDFDLVFPVKKPFVFTQLNKNSGIEGYGPIKVPHQNKNSEFLLLAVHTLVAANTGKSEKLRAINQFMEDHDIDVVQFESAVKVGAQGVVNINAVNDAKGTLKIKGHTINFSNFGQLDQALAGLLENGDITVEEALEAKRPYEQATYDQVYKSLADATGASSGQENPDIVHRISYEDYGIQVQTPEHYVEIMQAVGTQIRKLITADISDDASLTLDGITLSPVKDSTGKTIKTSKQRWMELYNDVVSENIIQSFAEINEKFKDPKEIEKLLHREIRNSHKYDPDLIRAATLDSDGKFRLPLHDPIQSGRIQALLTSVIKKNITKQKIKGGSLIQVSNYGLTDQLNVRWSDANGELIKTRDEFAKSYKGDSLQKDYDTYKKERQGKAVAHIECYMPWYMQSYLAPLMKVGTHELDINKVPDDLRKLIGYRIPTEDKYSMAPLYIKGFLPKTSGGAIMLPSDITTIAGSDFDVDKLYIMLPESQVKQLYNTKLAWDTFYQEHPEIAEKIESEKEKSFKTAIQNALSGGASEEVIEANLEALRKKYFADLKKQGYKNYDFLEGVQDKFSEWFKNRKQEFFVKEVLEKIQYDHNKPVQENNLKQRNNLMLDLMWGVLTNEDTASKLMNPGGFEKQKKTSRLLSIAENYTEKELREALKIKNSSSLYDALSALSLDQLTTLADKKKQKLNPLSPLTQIILHQRNMTGAGMIGIYANHNSHHAMMQHTELEVNSFGSFYLNNNKKTSLHSIMNNKGEIISKNNAGFLGASVDNAKEPVLGDLNQNTFTGDVSMLLSRLGYSSDEIGIQMRQPIVMDITKAYFMESRTGKDKETIVKEVIEKYKKRAEEIGYTSYENYKDNKFLIEDMFKAILLEKEMDALTDKSQTSDNDKVNFYNYQIAVGYNFLRMLKTGEALGQIVQANNSDTTNGAAGPSIAATQIKIQKLRDLYTIIDAPGNTFPLSNVQYISSSSLRDFENINDKRKYIKGSPLPILQSFYSLGLASVEDMLSPYFPEVNPSYVDAVESLKARTKANRLDEKTILSIQQEFTAYLLTGLPFFGSDSVDVIDEETGEIQKQIITSEQKRSQFINGFPEHFEKVLEEIAKTNPEIANLEFLKRLKKIKPSRYNPVTVLNFKNVGKLSDAQKSRFSRDWATMLYSPNPKVVELAVNLFRYSFYRNGLSFGPQTFAHLAPVAVRLAIPGYRDALNQMLKSTSVMEDFTDQYIQNHPDNRKFVPELGDDSSIEFYTDKDSEQGRTLKNEVIFDPSVNKSNEATKAIRSKSEQEDGTYVYDFFEYIAKRHGSGYAYYRRTSNSISTATYERFSPKGFKNNFLEYEIGKDANEVNTVIAQNDKDYKATEIADKEAAFFSSASLNEDDSNNFYNDFSSSYDPSALASEVNRVMGKTIMDVGVDTGFDLNSFDPNEDFTDDSNQPICK